jgi:hypothetical protein
MHSRPKYPIAKRYSHRTEDATAEHIKKIRKAVFSVAGLGPRFLPATKAMPKELLPIIDKPIVQYAVDEDTRPGLPT